MDKQINKYGSEIQVEKVHDWFKEKKNSDQVSVMTQLHTPVSLDIKPSRRIVWNNVLKTENQPVKFQSTDQNTWNPASHL